MVVHKPKSSALTYEEWLAQPYVQSLTSSETLGWKGIGLTTTQLIAAEGYQTSPITDDPFLIVVLSGSTRAHVGFHGKFCDETYTIASMMLVPPHLESSARWFSPVTAAFIQLSPHLIMSFGESSLHGDPSLIQLPPLINFHDPLLYHLIMALYNELKNPGLLGALFAESVAHTAMLHLLRKYSTAVVTLRPLAATHFTPKQMRLLNDYIDSHIDQKITLSDLAALFFMSVSHFERRFRMSQGCPPYRYVLERRMERGKVLLQYTRASIYEVARQCGFANQSHFTRHFTQFVGVSPARFVALAKK